MKRELYPSQAVIDKNINYFVENENKLFKKDDEFISFSFNKNSLESKLYNIKAKIQYDSNFNTIQLNGKNVVSCLQEIEDKLNENYNNIFDLTPLQNYLDNIIREITPKNILAHKEQLLSQINNYQNIINQENNKIKMGQPSKYNKNNINNALNMLANFRNKLYLILDPNELYSLNQEFENEKIKYF